VSFHPPPTDLPALTQARILVRAPSDRPSAAGEGLATAASATAAGEGLATASPPVAGTSAAATPAAGPAVEGAPVVGAADPAGFLGQLNQLLEAATALLHGIRGVAGPTLDDLASSLRTAVHQVQSSAGGARDEERLRKLVQAIAPSLYTLCVRHPQLIDTESEHICVQALFSPCVFILLSYLQERCPGLCRVFG